MAAMELKKNTQQHLHWCVFGRKCGKFKYAYPPPTTPLYGTCPQESMIKWTKMYVPRLCNPTESSAEADLEHSGNRD
jgi:hypothetical protein